MALGGGVGVDALRQPGEGKIQFLHSRAAYFHDLTRIAPSSHFFLFGLPFYPKCLLHTACGCESDCWIELVEIRYGIIFRLQ